MSFYSGIGFKTASLNFLLELISGWIECLQIFLDRMPAMRDLYFYSGTGLKSAIVPFFPELIYG